MKQAWMAAALALGLCRSSSGAQEWREAAVHLGTTARVLLIGTRPEDEDNALIAWLSLGRHVETAYLSLTRGESGINLTGSERQATLAVVRTGELLAERERDGAHQYFTRAYDMGPTTVDSVVEAGWPRDSLLEDMVWVIRAFRPQLIVSLASASDERDAARRFTASLTAAAFAAAADTAFLEPRGRSSLAPWAVSRLFTRVDAASGTAPDVAVDVGEFDRDAGRSYAEIGADIRQLQRSQGASPAPPIGRLQRLLRLDSTRVGVAGSLFGSLDTSFTRFHADTVGIPPAAQAELDTLRSELGDAYTAASRGSADSLAAQLARVSSRTSDVRLAMPCGDLRGVPACAGAAGDLAVALNTIRERATRAMLGASAVVIDGTVARELVAAGDSVAAVVSVYNGGATPLVIRRLAVTGGNSLSILFRDSTVTVPPDSAMRWSTNLRILAPTYHWWQINGLLSGTWMHDFRTTPGNPVAQQLIGGEDRIVTSSVEATIGMGGADVPIIVRPLAYRSSTAMRADTRHPLAGVPGISVLLERTAEYQRASLPVDRVFRVYLWSARSTPDTLAVTLRLPRGLKADSATRTVALPPFGSGNLFFRLHGTLGAGSDTISLTARSIATLPAAHSQSMVRVDPTSAYGLGVVSHDYPEMPSQQFVRFSTDRLEAVDARVPAGLRIAYVKGADDLQTPLGQLGVDVRPLDASLLPVVDLSGFTTVLVGSDALSADALSGAIPALHAFVRNGGTVVVLAGDDGIGGSGLLPYPIAFDSVSGAVSDPAAVVHVIDAGSELLRWPNAITAKDFEGWTGSRAQGVPAAFDPRYRTLFSMGDAGNTPTTGTVLVARMGKGLIVYTSLSIDQQLAAVNAGAARLMINLLSAGLGR